MKRTIFGFGFITLVFLAGGGTAFEGAPPGLTTTANISTSTKPVFNPTPMVSSGPIRPMIGAIRWDAWTGSSNTVGQVVEADLSPSSFHFRVPFYGVETGPASIQARCTTQTLMDQEIAFAKKACLDYWAFVWYPAGAGCPTKACNGLEHARNLYLSSPHMGDVKFCLIIENQNFPKISASEIIHDFKLSNYVKVLGNRPLLYLLGYGRIAKSDIENLRAEGLKAGLGNPYIVLLRVDANFSVLATLGLDAFSMYATSWIGGGAPFSTLASADREDWKQIKDLGYKVVPHVTAGWDKRPRCVTPVFFDPNPPGVNNFCDQWVAMPSPNELAVHVEDAVNWVRLNPGAAEANTVLVYAWNEFDEGGYLCPTLSRFEGDARIEAMHNHLCGVHR